MLEVQQLAVNYQGISGLRDVSFRIQPSELVGLVGPNGADKSTMLEWSYFTESVVKKPNYS